MIWSDIVWNLSCICCSSVWTWEIITQKSWLLRANKKSPQIKNWRCYSWKFFLQLALLQKNKQKTLPVSCNLPVVYCETSVVSSFPDNGAEVQWVQSLFNEMNKMCWTTRAAIMHFSYYFFSILSYIEGHYDNLYCTYKWHCVILKVNTCDGDKRS